MKTASMAASTIKASQPSINLPVPQNQVVACGAPVVNTDEGIKAPWTTEEEDHVLVLAEMPGVSAEDVKITVEDDLLTITAARGEGAWRGGKRLAPSAVTRVDDAVVAISGMPKPPACAGAAALAARTAARTTAVRTLVG